MNEKVPQVRLKYEYSKLIKESQSIDHPKEEPKTLPICEKDLWKKYRRLVWKITEKQPISKLPNAKERAFFGYHLDHKVSIWYGFKNKIDPKLIGSIDNLEFIPWKQNSIKGIRCNFKGSKAMQTILFV